MLNEKRGGLYMSTNYKNIHRAEYFKNYTTKIKHREILVHDNQALSGDIEKTIKRINSQVNQIIQQLNLSIHDRQIPYITLEIKYRDEIGKKARMVLIERDTDETFQNNIQRSTSAIGHDISHFIQFLAPTAYKEIVISPLGCDAEIVIHKDYIEGAIIDILLDIVMFNSYSFLKNMTISKKHDFCQEKLDYFNEKALPCFYEYKGEKPMYYSFAFTARTDKNTFDVRRYIELWNTFISARYPNCAHIEKTIAEQLKQHVDYHELPKNLASSFSTKPAGAYLILRTNKDITENLHPSICKVFDIRKYSKGYIKIISMNEFTQFEFLCVNLDVSVYKIVKS